MIRSSVTLPPIQLVKTRKESPLTLPCGNIILNFFLLNEGYHRAGSPILLHFTDQNFKKTFPDTKRCYKGSGQAMFSKIKR